MKIEQWKIEDVIPYKNNPRINDDAVEKTAMSIQEYGWQQPIVVDADGIVIVGHTRLKAAKSLDIDSVPVLVAGNLSEAQVKAYRIADNKTGEIAEWDEELLGIEIQELVDLDFDIELTGFDVGDFDFLQEEESGGLTDDDAVPEVPEEPVTKLGDLWILGEHQLLCGDSTDIEQVERLMGVAKADMVFTSPPYNANTKTGDGDIFGPRKSKNMYRSPGKDNLSSIEYLDFARAVLKICFQKTDGFIFWNVSYNAKSKFEYIAQINEHLEYLIEQICWKKSSTIPFKGMLMRDWEPIYIFSTNKQNINVKSVTSNYWEINNTNSQNEEHKACFPVALPEKGISLVNKNTGIIYEPFAGSGTTLIAAEKTNRKCYGMELDPHYCDVIVKRWEEYTGLKAEVQSL